MKAAGNEKVSAEKETQLVIIEPGMQSGSNPKVSTCLVPLNMTLIAERYHIGQRSNNDDGDDIASVIPFVPRSQPEPAIANYRSTERKKKVYGVA
jgi:hypothetical protein